MSVRERLPGCVVAATLMLFGCSAGHPRDINLDTDVGVGFVPPDAGSPKDGLVEESGTSVDENGGETSVDESKDAVVPDLDASIDGNS
jgi:hypothetical protein